MVELLRRPLTDQQHVSRTARRNRVRNGGLMMAADEVDVIVMPLVSTTHGHHVAVLMMIVVDTVENRLPVTEVPSTQSNR